MSYELRIKAFDSDADYENAVQAILQQLVQRAAQVLNTNADNIVVRGFTKQDLVDLGSPSTSADVTLGGVFSWGGTAGVESVLLGVNTIGTLQAAGNLMCTVPVDKVVCLAGITDTNRVLLEALIRNKVGIVGRYSAEESRRKDGPLTGLYSRAVIFSPNDQFQVTGLTGISSIASEVHHVAFVAEKNGDNVSVA